MLAVCTVQSSEIYLNPTWVPETLHRDASEVVVVSSSSSSKRNQPASQSTWIIASRKFLKREDSLDDLQKV